MIDAFQNPWVKKIKDTATAESQRKLREAMAKKAQEILADEKFKTYKEMYQTYHDNEMENILMLGEQDPIKYAFKVRQIVDTLKAYRLLISAIEEDAQIKVEDVI